MEQYIIENLKRVFGNNITIGVDRGKGESKTVVTDRVPYNNPELLEKG